MKSTALVLSIAALAAPLAWAEETSVPLRAQEAIAGSLPWLERDGFAWFEGRIPIQNGQKCVSCHQVAFAVWSHAEATRAGVTPESSRIAELERLATEFVIRPGKGRAANASPMLLGLDRRREHRDPVSAHAVARVLEEQQEKDGHWRAKGQFPTQNRPIEETDAVATMWAVFAQASLMSPPATTVAARERALEWLRDSAPGESTEWLATRLLVEEGAGETATVGGLRDSLLARQNDDGGWPFLDGLPSDALTTGQVLYVLSTIGDPSDSPAARRAVRWLLATQREDGTWLVPSELTSTEPTPGKDYVYTYWGTAWAVIGLSRSLP